MTRSFNQVSEDSRINEFVGSALTGLMLVVFGVVSVVSVFSLIHI